MHDGHTISIEPTTDAVLSEPQDGESMATETRPRIDIAALRESLAGRQGEEYWQSLEQLAETPEFKDYLEHEFPDGADASLDPVTRRHFLKIMGASFALAGVSACTVQPQEKIVPYVRSPENFIPGRPVFYTSAVLRSGYATGVLVESHMGRPTKVEGNPDHPASLGATDPFAQAEILNLYDPDRSTAVLERGSIGNWSDFVLALNAQMDQQLPKRGAGLRILTETVTSPTLADQIRRIRQAFPAARWHQYDPVGREAVREGNRLAIGREADVVYHFDKADVIVSLDADFLYAMPGNVRYGRDFIGRRRVTDGSPAMNRLYVVESSPTPTGAMADHRMPLRAAEVDAFARALAAEFGISAGTGPLSDAAKALARAAAQDLRAAGAKGVVVPGDGQAPYVHFIAHRINQSLGSVGSAVEVIPPVQPATLAQGASIADLVADIDAGRVDTLIVLGGNPVYTAPADLGFADRYSTVKFRAHLSLYNDETSRLSHWHIPAAHPFEMWGDARAHDGTVSVIQPLIAPLYGGRSPYEVLAILTKESSRTGYDLLRGYWQTQATDGAFEDSWRSALTTGVLAIRSTTAGGILPPPGGRLPAGTVDTTAAATVAPATTSGAAVDTAAPRAAQPPAATPAPPPAAEPDPTEGEFEIIFRPDPTIWDGSFSNNGWMQELPKPITKLTWENAAYLSPALAERLELASGDMVALTYKGRTVNAPVLVVPGHADGSVTVFYGYGRQGIGRVADAIGYNAFALRSSDAPSYGYGLAIRKLGERTTLATTQHHFTLDGRDLVRSGTVEEFRKNASLAPEGHHEIAHATMFPPYEYDGYKWGMAIDMNACIGCNACVVACVAENNIPVVGKDQVIRGREMHWLRVDTYYKGSIDSPDTYFQPILCMHCETAPCEVVCPVNATVHSHEGLNDMVYNRCIGTRYCSNNCPYKVRRFNFLNYTEDQTETERLGKNPDVTIRSRGVMEKCTYCVQRINAARIDAKRENRRIVDGEIQTACQAVCPTEAIVFGDINDKESEVVRRKSEPRNYGLLTELNTQPRTTYLGRVRNPNPGIRA